jgi:hypothetical protein
VDLLTRADTAELIATGDKIRRHRHDANVYHVHSLNLNPTNLCENRCGLCAFWREPGSNDAYILSLRQAEDRLETAKGWGLTDVHIVGGLNRELDLNYYLELLRITSSCFGGTSPDSRGKSSGFRSRRQNGGRGTGALKAAGLMPCRAEGRIFPRVRDNVEKISADQWLHAQTAHCLGILTAPPCFRHVETRRDRGPSVPTPESADQTGGFRLSAPSLSMRKAHRSVWHGLGGHASSGSYLPHLLDNFISGLAFLTASCCRPCFSGPRHRWHEHRRDRCSPGFNDCPFPTPRDGNLHPRAGFNRHSPAASMTTSTGSHRPCPRPPQGPSALQRPRTDSSTPKGNLASRCLCRFTNWDGRSPASRAVSVISNPFIIDRNISLRTFAPSAASFVRTGVTQGDASRCRLKRSCCV